VRQSITDKIKGVDKLFVVGEDLPDTVTSPVPTKETDTVPNTQPSTDTSTVILPSTETVTDTVTSPLIKPTDAMFRMIGYYTEVQRNFIKKKAKKYKVTEAEIMRIAVEELIKSGKI
jgi:hypothetical protein